VQHLTAGTELLSVHGQRTDSDHRRERSGTRESALGQTGDGALMTDGGEWALVQFVLTDPSTATQDQLVSMQDGAAIGVFFRVSPGSTWLLRGLAFVPAQCSFAQIGVPLAVAELWGTTEQCT
jgi:hypothetical protein